MRFQRILISVLALAAVGAPAWATSTTIYCSGSCNGNDQTTFNTITSSVAWQGLTFNPADLSHSTGYTEDGVTIEDYYQTDSNLSASGGALSDNFSWGFLASLPSIVNNFWFQVASGTSGTSLLVSFTDSSGIHTQSLAVGLGTAFFGVTSTGPITNLQLFNSSSGTRTFTLTSFDIDGSSSDPADAPEGATLLLIGSGLIAMRFFKKRDKARAARQAQTAERPAAVSYAAPQIAAS